MRSIRKKRRMSWSVRAFRVSHMPRRDRRPIPVSRGHGAAIAKAELSISTAAVMTISAANLTAADGRVRALRPNLFQVTP